MNAIIFSKNRALQCDALIRSIKMNCNIFSRIEVLYKTEYDESYTKLQNKHQDVIFTPETHFKNNLMSMILEADNYCALFVDDCIVHRQVEAWQLHECFEDEVDIISLRLGENINIKQHFEYKGSIDGNIFKKDILLQLAKYSFYNPNKLEIQLCRIAKDYLMAWMTKPYLIGIPANKVSNTSTCYEMGVGVEELNDLWMKGYEIDFNNMNFESNNVHENIEYAYKLGGDN